MAFVPATNVVQVQIVCQILGQTVENVLNFHLSGANDISEAMKLCENVVTWWNTYIAPITTSDVTLQKVIATDLSSSSGYSMTYTTGLPAAGTSVDTLLPNNVAVAVKLLTNGRGRGMRGRVFHPGITHSNVVGSTVQSGLVSALKTAYEAAMVIATLTGSADLVVLSKYLGHAARLAGVATNVSAIFVDSTTDSQRRRLPGRGR
jgi:hypothetical protein